MKIRFNATRFVIGTLLASTLTLAGAQETWPNRPIRLVVPYPPGGGTDAVVRIISPKLSVSLGQPVVIENRGGANTIIGSEAVARAAPDGYTFGVITDSHSINPNFHKLPYDSLTSFTPVSQLVTVPFALVVPKTSPYKTVGQLLADAKANPGKVTYASLGDGSPHYLAMEWLRSLAKADLVHIPYKGVGPAMTDVIGSQVQSMFTGLSTAIPQVSAGRLNTLAVSSPKRHATLPSVPAVAETPGLEMFEYRSWYGVVAPFGVPPPIVNRMSSEIRKVLSDAAVQERLRSMGVDTETSTPEEFTKFLKEDATRYTKIIRITGAKGGN